LDCPEKSATRDEARRIAANIAKELLGRIKADTEARRPLAHRSSSTPL
jgi:hypothetical protein